ncbi:MAG: 1-acyl-sn-glycerol-3-phosphate acyltransferase [Selenomonadaceae bacterium]|nr:1-acyl-sn-glycerol-3-phosphate acyltransferase [Selenomonadaceae bacterium]
MFYSMLRIFFRAFFKVLFGARVIGRENLPAEGAIILAANHMSNWDPPLLATFLERKVNYMAKEELFANKIFATAITNLGAFPVKRETADRNAIKRALALLKAGKCLGLFPEGTRSKTGELGKAEAGVGLIAAMSKAPVLPAAIIGTNKIFSSGKFFPRLTVIYGRPIKFEGSTKDKAALESFSQSIMDEIAKLIASAK